MTAPNTALAIAGQDIMSMYICSTSAYVSADVNNLAFGFKLNIIFSISSSSRFDDMKCPAIANALTLPASFPWYPEIGHANEIR